MRVAEPASAPPPELIFRRRIKLAEVLRELWRARALVRSLAERDLRARYKQASLGFAWAVLTPLALMVVFTVFFQRVAQVDTGGSPYPLFTYLGLVPWTFFSASLSLGGQSLITNKALLDKVYCPREVFPIASVAVAGVDALASTAAFGILLIVYTFVPHVQALWLPVLLVVQVAFTLGVVLIVSAVLVYLRDLRHALPILLQLGLFATPVAYGMDKIPSSARLVYSILNPLAPVIDGYRRTILQGLPPDWSLLVPAAGSSTIILVAGYHLFKRLETRFADVA